MSAMGDESKSTSDEQQRSSQSAEVPMSLSRRRVWVTLGTLLVIQVVVCIVVSLVHVYAPNGVPSWLHYAIDGAVISQPMLVAIATAIGPGTWFVRFPTGMVVVVALGLLRDFAHLTAGRPLYHNDLVEFWLLPFVLLQALLLGVRWVRGWWVVWMNAPEVGTVGRAQFSLRWLLAIVSCMAMILAIVRWTIDPVALPEFAAYFWSQDWLSTWIVLTTVGISMGATPLVVAALGTKHRGYGLGAAVVGLGASAWFLYWLIPFVPDRLELAIGLLPTAWLWILANLLVLRWCGFRLVRESTRATIASKPYEASI